MLSAAVINGNDKIENGLAGRHSELLVLVVDASAEIGSVHVVGEEGVAAVLREPSEMMISRRQRLPQVRRKSR